MAERPEIRVSSSWPEGIAVTLSIIALLVSGYSLIAAKKQHEDERATELLDQVYEDWDEMIGVDQWEVLHLNELAEGYEETRDSIRAYVSELPIQDQRRIRLLERATALRIFNWFELHLRQWALAQEMGDEGRVELLNQEMEYYTQFYLRNPRLLWFWSEEGGGMVHQMDPPTVEYYTMHVLNDPDFPLRGVPDPIGIVGGLTGPEVGR
jgi:hypothetical protein